MGAHLVCHSLPSAWKYVGSLQWSWFSLDVACAHCSFTCTLACFACSTIHENILTSFFILPFMNKSPCMCFHCSSHSSSRHVLSIYLYLQSLMTRSPSNGWTFIELHYPVSSLSDYVLLPRILQSLRLSPRNPALCNPRID